jgi:hypothetical protein
MDTYYGIIFTYMKYLNQFIFNLKLQIQILKSTSSQRNHYISFNTKTFRNQQRFRLRTPGRLRLDFHVSFLADISKAFHV